MNGAIDSVTMSTAYTNGTQYGYNSADPATRQWEQTYPLSYIYSQPDSLAYMIASPTCVYTGEIGAGWKLHGTGGGYTFAAGTVTGGSGWVWSNNLTTTTALPQAITSAGLTLTWELSTDNGVSWFTVGQSTNHLYVNGSWSANNQFETVVNIGCEGANGLAPDGTAANNAAILDSIWTKQFSTGTGPANVTRVDRRPLTYYGSMTTLNVTTAQLLRDGDGECGTWATLFIDVLKAEGCYTNYSVPASPSYAGDYVFVTAGSYASGFLVNGWAFPAAGVPGTSGIPQFPYLNIPDPAFADGLWYIRTDPTTHVESWAWLYSQVSDQGGVAGQNSANPQSVFGNHQVVRIVTSAGTKYYDPSYGLIYNDLADMESKAIAGYFLYGDLGVKESDVGVDLDHDGVVGANVVTVKVFAIGKNDLGGHLVIDQLATY